MTGNERSAEWLVGKVEQGLKERSRTAQENETPTEWLVGKLAEFEGTDRKVVYVDEKEIGIFWRNGRFYAYENLCLHQGGPVCEGLVLNKIESVLGEDRGVITERISEEEIHIVCPWHGWEYDLFTGRCATDERLRLKKYEVVQRGDEVYVIG